MSNNLSVNMEGYGREYLNAINNGEAGLITPSNVLVGLLSELDEYEGMADMLDAYYDSGKDLTVFNRVLTTLYENSKEL